jgi:hypothetical protein
MKYILIIACVMAGITSFGWGFLAITSEQRLYEKLVPIKEEGLEKMQAVQEMVVGFHHRIYFQLASCFWYFVLAGLLLFIIRRLRNSN